MAEGSQSLWITEGITVSEKKRKHKLVDVIFAFAHRLSAQSQDIYLITERALRQLRSLDPPKEK